MIYKLITISSVSTSNQGTLCFVESERNVDFEFKRFYYIHHAPKQTVRGFHAHKILKQLLFCPYGHIDITLDDGRTRQTITLDSPDKGLVIHASLWREMLWKQDNSVLCVLVSDYYDEADYIRDYDEFIKYKGIVP